MTSALTSDRPFILRQIESSPPPCQLWVISDLEIARTDLIQWIQRLLRPSYPQLDEASILSGAHSDIRWLRLENSKTITVQEVHEMQSWAHLRSAQGTWRFAVIEQAEELHKSAQNALLKILEDVPEKLVFVLLSSQPERLLPTIRSRCFIVRWPAKIEKLVEDPYLDSFLEGFSLHRAEFEDQLQEQLSDKEMRENFIEKLPLLGHMFLDLWRLSISSKPGALRFPHLEPKYQEVLALRNSEDWLCYLERTEWILRQQKRNFNDQLLLENLYHEVFLGLRSPI